ncbi:MAG TPA: sigma-70 family RNA polymerase sigma factor, partial [Candidatus Acidoferrum sp.]|nr:sigma-70 family RNA polymerase sigma factor [Candidatus Acidoferrum sp.]
DEGAFRQLVEQYLDLVYSTAVRRVGGDAALAQDVTQAVFTDLARKAASLRNVEMLGGWLHRHTGFVASNMVRSEQRRQVREQEAAQMNVTSDSSDSLWQQLAPMLDDTIESLEPSDRQAVLLRFFERQDFRHIGNALGISDDAAQKRVSRALEKLRALLTERGVTLSVILLSSLLAGRVVMAAPAGMAGNVARIALRGAAGGGLGLALLKLTKTHALKIVLTGALAATAIWLLASHRPTSAHEITLSTNQVASAAASTNVTTSNTSPATASVSPTTDTNATSKTLLLNIVAADSGKPVPDVELDYWLWINGNVKHKKLLHATRMGICKVPIPDHTTELSLVSERDGFADTLLDWHPDHGEQIPAQYTLSLARAVPIGGTVIGPDGNPVAGAEVGFGNQPDPGLQTRPQSDDFSWPFWITATTDSQGHWQINRIGKEAIRTADGHASHPEFVESSFIYLSSDLEAKAQLLAGTYTFRLGQAVTVQGIVKDPAGNPVPNARLQVGPNGDSGTRKGKSQSNGTFSIRGCKPGQTVITAQSTGYAPATLDVDLTNDSGPLELLLRPGKVLKLRVVDRNGNPVAHAGAWLDTYQHGLIVPGHKQPLWPQVDFNRRTDANGRLEWDGAPAGDLEFQISADGYLGSEDVTLQADGTEHLITLQRGFAISGTVSDANTGQAIPHFRIITGWPNINPIEHTTNATWSPIDRFWLSFAKGTFQYTYDEVPLGGVKDPAYMFKFEADGYTPFIAGPVPASAGSAHFDVALTPATTTTITVLSPDNQSAANIDVALISSGTRVSLTPGGFSHENLQSGGTFLSTDDHGQFTLSSDPSVTKIVAAGQLGYGEATPAELAANPIIQMAPWGRLEGTYLTNGVPAAGCTLSLGYGPEGSLDTISCDSRAFQTTTDPQGRFILAQVPPGNRQMMLVIPFSDNFGHNGWTERPLQSITVDAGETNTVTVDNTNPYSPIFMPFGKPRAK